jgi:antitoxin VapB
MEGAILANEMKLQIDEIARSGGGLLKIAPSQGDAIPRPRRRMTVEQMRALGAEIAALPLLDPRSPAEIMDDLNAL